MKTPAVTDIYAILLIPDDPSILREGPCGTRPPTASRWAKIDAKTLSLGPISGWSPRQIVPECSAIKSQALVLAWEGETLWSGVDWLLWHQHKAKGMPGRQAGLRSYNHTPTPQGLPEHLWDAYEQAWLAAEMDDAGTLILLDANGKEINNGR